MYRLISFRFLFLPVNININRIPPLDTHVYKKKLIELDKLLQQLEQQLQKQLLEAIPAKFLCSPNISLADVVREDIHLISSLPSLLPSISYSIIVDPL